MDVVPAGLHMAHDWPSWLPSVCYWLPWPMTGMWPFVTLSFIWLQCPQASAFSLKLAPIATDSWLPYFIPSSPFASPTAIPISSIISIAMTCLFSGSLAQTLTPSSYGFLPVLASCSFLPFWLSLSPTCTLFLPSWRCAPLKADARLFSPVVPTCLQSPYSMGPSSLCTYNQVLIIPLTQTSWPLSSIQWSFPCWTL